jgi:hypothetical protein
MLCSGCKSSSVGQAILGNGARYECNTAFGFGPRKCPASAEREHGEGMENREQGTGNPEPANVKHGFHVALPSRVRVAEEARGSLTLAVRVGISRHDCKVL